jgi:hypothetical protein
MLAHRFRRVVLLLDGDEFGREAVLVAVGKLVAAEVEDILPVLLLKRSQPDELAIDDLRTFLRVPEDPEGALVVVEDIPSSKQVPTLDESMSRYK